MMLKVLGPSIEGEDQECTVAKTAAEARDRLTESWDLMVIDDNLPDANAINLVRDIRQDTINQDIWILIMSSDPQLAGKVRRLRDQRIHFVDKMAGTAAIRTSLDELCSQT